MGPNHLQYNVSVFSYTAYPTVIVEIDCFNELNAQTNCYQYHFTWATLGDYNDWLIVARSLRISGTTAKRLRGMFDALNLFLRAGPQTVGGTARGTWTQIQKVAGPCPSGLAAYWTFEEAAGPWLDKVHAYSLPRGASNRIPGLVNWALQMPNSSLIQTTTTVIPFDPSTAQGISWFYWTQLPHFGAFNSCQLTITSPGNAFLLQQRLTAINTTSVEYFNGIQSAAHPFMPGTVNWHLLCGSFNCSTRLMTAWLDGASVASVTSSFVPFTAPSVAYKIQTSNSGNTNNLAETGIYIGAPLTSAQAVALYNGGAGVTWPAVNTIFP